MNEVIKIKNLNYGNILDNINLTIYENTINYISGSNNCGKNTFIRILTGDINTIGNIFYKNKDINNMSSYELSMFFGRVLSLDASFNFNTVKEELLYKLDKLNLDSAKYKQQYNYVINLLSIKDILEMNTNNLNEYQRLKLLLGIELLKKPSIIIFNDVFNYLSKKNKLELITIINELKKTTAIIITSNSLDLSIYCDYLHLFNKGKLILSGPVMEVLEKDSIINKLGLDLPFMVDLSLKLKYYDLINNIELDMNRMVNNLWK